MDLTKRTTQQRIIDADEEFKEKYERVKEQLLSDNRLDLSTLKRWNDKMNVTNYLEDVLNEEN